MIEPIAQEGQTHARHGPHDHRGQQASTHAWFHRESPESWRDQNAPGNRALGHLQAKALARLDVGGEVVARHLQLLLQRLVLLHLARVDQETA